MKKYMFVALVVALISELVLVGCATPASPATTPSAPAPTATTASKTASPLDLIIEGAKKEKGVAIRLSNTVDVKSVPRLKKEIKDMFGVDLDIQYSPASLGTDFTKAIMEAKGGLTPTFDLVTTYPDAAIEVNKAGALEEVDWKSLFTKDTNPEVATTLPSVRGHLVQTTAHTGALYNPEKISASEVPASLKDMANPKWAGKIAIPPTTGYWARWAVLLGKDKLWDWLRAIVANKAMVTNLSDIYNRFLLGEIWIARTNTMYYPNAIKAGVPVAFTVQDIDEVVEYTMFVSKGAAHPNGAKLVALYIASPAGAKFMWEEAKSGNMYYSGNYEYDQAKEAEKRGVPRVSFIRDQKLVDAMSSPDIGVWAKEVDLIVKGVK